MNGYISLIRFHNLALKMRPYFIAETDKMDKVDVVICTGEPDADISFSLSDNIQNIAIPQEGEPKFLKGEMYLDLSKEKIIFEGIYRVGEDSNTFWLEIDPNSDCFKNQGYSNIDTFSNIAFKCEDYPLSVGSVAFDVSAPASSTSAKRNGGPQAVAKLTELTGNVYLHTILSNSNSEVRGINTCLGEDMNGFVGDIGILRNKVYINGEMVEEGITNCYIYAELGESFLI